MAGIEAIWGLDKRIPEVGIGVVWRRATRELLCGAVALPECMGSFDCGARFKNQIALLRSG
jgi:hypothetical protein